MIADGSMPTALPKSAGGIFGRFGAPTWFRVGLGGLSLGRALFSRSIRFLALRRLASSGVAVITTSSADISVYLIHGAHILGTSTTTVGTLWRSMPRIVSMDCASIGMSRSTMLGEASRLNL